MGISVKRIVKSVLWGHTVGLAMLILLSCVAMMLPYPSKSVTVLGVLSVSLGSIFLGFYQRGKQAVLSEAIVSGALYGLIPLIVSLFGKGEQFAIGYRLTLALVAILLAVLPSWLFKKRKKRRRVSRR